MSDAAMPALMPAPDLERRDSLGRLISLTWKGECSCANTSGERWLVAVDGSACSSRAVAVGARLVAMGQGSMLELVNVQPWLSKEAAETELGRYGWAATARARRALAESATLIPWHLHVVMGDDAIAIVGLAESLGCFGICIGSHGLTATEAVLLGSVTCKVLRLARMPVLIVR